MNHELRRGAAAAGPAEQRQVIRSSRRDLLRVLSAAAPASVVLAACGGATTTSSPAQGAQTGGAKSLTPATIGWDTFRGQPGGDTTWPTNMIKTFQEKNPQIKVDFRPIALDNGSQQSAYPKMYAMAAAGTLGDVFAWDPSHWVFYQAINRNVIKPIDAYIARDKFDLTQYYKVFIDYQRWQGKIWGLPSWGWTGHDGLLYNSQLADQAGVTFPAYTSADWTFNKLYDIVVKIGKFVEKTGGFGMTTTMPSAIAMTIFARAFNGDNLSPDGKKSTLLDASVKDGMRWVYDLATKEKVIALPGAYQGDPFLNGTLGMEQAGSLSVFTRNKQNKDGALKFKTALFPKRKDGKRPSQLRGGTWNTGNASKYPDHGWEFIKHITNREGILTFNSIGGEGALTRPDIMTDDYFKDPNFRVYLENFENAMLHVVPANYRGTEFEAAFTQFGLPWYKGEVGFEDGLTTLNTEVQKILDMPAV